MSEMDMTTAPRYQSSLRVRAVLVTPDMLDGDNGFEAEVDGQRLEGKAGDYVVQMPDGRLEVWAGEQFEREFETEKRTRELKIRTGAPS